MPAAAPDAWMPSDSDLATVPAEGRAFIADMLHRYEGFSAVEGRLLIEAGQAVSALAALRAMDDDDQKVQRLEMAWSRLLAGHLAQLRVQDR